MKQKHFIIFACFMLMASLSSFAQDEYELYEQVKIKSKKTKNKWIDDPWAGERHHYKLIFKTEGNKVEGAINYWVDCKFGEQGIHFHMRQDSIAINENDKGGLRNFIFEGKRMQMQWFSTYKNDSHSPENDWVTEEYERVNWFDLRPEVQRILNWTCYDPEYKTNLDTLGLKGAWYRSGFAWTDNNSGNSNTTVVPDGRNQDYYKFYGKDYMMTVLATPKKEKKDHWLFEPYTTINGWIGPVEYLGKDLTREWYSGMPVIHHWVNKDTIHSIFVDSDLWQKKGDTMREVWVRCSSW